MAESAEKPADVEVADTGAEAAAGADADAEKQRIAQLEAEVTRLREKLGDSGPEPEDEAVEATIVRRASPQRIAVLVTLIVVVSLAVMIAIFSALSTGLTKVADKAAGMFVPDQQSQGSGSSGSAPAPRRAPRPAGGSTDNAPRAPGL